MGDGGSSRLLHLKIFKNRQQAPQVVLVRVGVNHKVKPADPLPGEVGNDNMPPRVERGPAEGRLPPSVHQQPAPVGHLQQDGVPLPDIYKGNPEPPRGAAQVRPPVQPERRQDKPQQGERQPAARRRTEAEMGEGDLAPGAEAPAEKRQQGKPGSCKAPGGSRDGQGSPGGAGKNSKQALHGEGKGAGGGKKGASQRPVKEGEEHPGQPQVDHEAGKGNHQDIRHQP